MTSAPSGPPPAGHLLRQGHRRAPRRSRPAPVDPGAAAPQSDATPTATTHSAASGGRSVRDWSTSSPCARLAHRVDIPGDLGSVQRPPRPHPLGSRRRHPGARHRLQLTVRLCARDRESIAARGPVPFPMRPRVSRPARPGSRSEPPVGLRRDERDVRRDRRGAEVSCMADRGKSMDVGWRAGRDDGDGGRRESAGRRWERVQSKACV